MLVAVYGSLKKDYGNHRVMEEAGGKFVGNGITQKDTFIMDGYGYPYIIEKPNHSLARRVMVEVYNVKNIEPLDWLEGHPTFYKRVKEKIRMDNGEVKEAWLYIYQNDIEANENLIENNIYVW